MEKDEMFVIIKCSLPCGILVSVFRFIVDKVQNNPNKVASFHSNSTNNANVLFFFQYTFYNPRFKDI